MATDASNSSSTGSGDDDWRLEFELDASDGRRSLHDLLGRVRGPDVVHDVESSVPHDVVRHPRWKAAVRLRRREATLKRARGAIEDALRRDESPTACATSRWDEERTAGSRPTPR